MRFYGPNLLELMEHGRQLMKTLKKRKGFKRSFLYHVSWIDL